MNIIHKRPGLILLFILLVTAGFLQSCNNSADGYYVSQSGDDNNPGTKKKPFKSLQKLGSVILKPGDKIYLHGSETFTGTLLLTANGTIEKPVIISSYGKGTATIDGGNKEAVIIHGSHFQLKNINAKGSGRKTGNGSNGISLVETTNGMVENVRTEGFQKSGIEVKSGNNIELKKIFAVNNGFSGIHVTGTDKKRSKNILVKDCKAENNPGDPTVLDNHSGNGILAGWSDSVMIDHCTATNNGWDMPRVGNGPVGIWAYECSYLTIQYCISYRNRTSKGAKDGGGFDLDGGITNSVIQYCLSYENEGAGYGLFQYWGASLWYNNIVRYCVSINDATTTEGSGGIFIWNGSPDSVQLAGCIVHNNVVYSTHAPAVEFEPSSPNKNFSFYNNIFLGSGSIVHGPSSGEKFTGNVWWPAGDEITFRGYKSLLEWATATGQEKHNQIIMGMQVDPQLKGPLLTTITDPYQLQTLTGYTLLPQSPLKNKGLRFEPLSKIPVAAHDFFGNPALQGNNPEPGIYEIKE
jgi:hypothetical protein